MQTRAYGGQGVNIDNPPDDDSVMSEDEDDGTGS